MSADSPESARKTRLLVSHLFELCGLVVHCPYALETAFDLYVNNNRQQVRPVASIDLEGKVVLTTGASSGIGAAIAREAAVRGAMSLLVGRNARKLTEVEDLIRAQGGRSKVQFTFYAAGSVTVCNHSDRR